MQATNDRTKTWNESSRDALLQFLPNEHSQYQCQGFALPHWTPMITIPDGDGHGRLARLRASVDELIALQFSHDGAPYDISEEENRQAVITGWRMVGFYGREFGAYTCYSSGLELGNVCDTVHKVLVKKQMDYGHGNIKRFGRIGLIVRMQDKVARLENLMSKYDDEQTPQNESILDNVIDVMGYSAIGIMWEKDEFLLPLDSPLS